MGAVLFLFHFGNMFRKKKKTEIVFALLVPKQNYVIGEQITGNILFRKDQSIKFNGIQARFFGTETITLSTSIDVSESKRSKTRPLSDANYATVADKGKAPEGDTIYPIKFTIPSDLPPSISCPNTAEIKYELQAELLFKSATSNITSVVEIFLQKPIPKELPLTFTDKTSWGLISKETLHIRCIPDKSMYLPGDTITMDVNFTNSTKKDVVRIISGLHQVLKYGKKSNDTCVNEKEISRELLPIPTGEKFSADLTFDVPENIVASARSHYINLGYVATFKCELDGGNETTFKVPVAIRGTLAKEEIAVTHKKPPPEPEDETYGSNVLLPDYIPNGPPPPIPDRSTRSEMEDSDLPSYIPSDHSDFSLPNRIETPQQSGAEISMTGSSHIMLAKIEEPPPQLPMPYGHPCYFDAISHYSPPTYVYTEPRVQARIDEAPPPYNPAAAQLMSL